MSSAGAVGGSGESGAGNATVYERAPVVPDVLEEHLQEIAFLSIQRRKLLFAADVLLTTFFRHDERIAAHWDGIVTGMPESIEIAKAKLEEFDPWEGYAAARIWIELGGASWDEVATAINAADPEVHGSWREVLRRIPRARFAQLVPQTMPANPALAGIVIYTAGSHDSLNDNMLASATFSTDNDLRIAAARACGWARSSAQAPALLATLLKDSEEPVRRAALWSMVTTNTAGAAGYCYNRMRSGEANLFDKRVFAMIAAPEHLEMVRPTISPADEAWFFGKHFPWQGAAEEIPMRAIWRSLFYYPRPDLEWLRQEIPDGFFSDELLDVAVAGE